MYKKLIKTENKKINQIKVDFIKKVLYEIQKLLIMCQKKIHLRLKKTRK